MPLLLDHSLFLSGGSKQDAAVRAAQTYSAGEPFRPRAPHREYPLQPPLGTTALAGSHSLEEGWANFLNSSRR